MEFKLADELKNDRYVKKVIDNHEFVISDNARYLLSYADINSNILLCFNDRKDNVVVNVNDVLYFESFSGDVFAKANGKVLKVKKKLFELEKQYQNCGFIRINKSQILNIYHVEKIKGSFSRKFILFLDNGEKLEVNRSYYKMFKERLEI